MTEWESESWELHLITIFLYLSVSSGILRPHLYFVDVNNVSITCGKIQKRCKIRGLWTCLRILKDLEVQWGRETEDRRWQLNGSVQPSEGNLQALGEHRWAFNPEQVGSRCWECYSDQSRQKSLSSGFYWVGNSYICTHTHIYFCIFFYICISTHLLIYLSIYLSNWTAIVCKEYSLSGGIGTYLYKYISII